LAGVHVVERRLPLRVLDTCVDRVFGLTPS
jgi:hypothetical protein